MNENDYTPEEQALYQQYVASGNIAWLSDSLIVSRRKEREWERATGMWMVRFKGVRAEIIKVHVRSDHLRNAQRKNETYRGLVARLLHRFREMQGFGATDDDYELAMSADNALGKRGQ